MKQESIKILFLAAEADPFVKIGGLGDYAGSLPAAIRNLHTPIFEDRQFDIRLVIPFHRCISREKWGINFLTKFVIIKGSRNLRVNTYYTIQNNIPVYLIGGIPFEKQSKEVYSTDQNQDNEKYAFFSIACLELIKHLKWRVDIIHANDWHTSFALHKLFNLRQEDKFYKRIHSLLTIHNLAYMGHDSQKILRPYSLTPISNPALPEWASKQPLPIGLTLADRIVVVSPTYAKEIQTPEFGYGLERILRKRRHEVRGILSGLDYKKWNPFSDNCISYNFSMSDVSTRSKNKSAVQNFIGFEENSNIPLFTYIGRMDNQKGVDILLKAFGKLTHQYWQLALLGTGNHELEESCKKFEILHPHQVRSLICYDDKLARMLYAGADLIIIPSRYEPCGTIQMIAMHYGCIPIAHATGGLKDTIDNEKNGFLYNSNDPKDLLKAIKKVIRVYKNDRSAWKKIQTAGMVKDLSWNKSAIRYAREYINLLNK